jgi:hypothetical protein
MANKLINGRIQHKHDTEANWIKATNFIPKKGELIVYDADSTHAYTRIKIGDGTTKVNSLPFTADKSELATHIATHAPSNAEKNQNAFSNIAVSGQTTVAADTTTDTVTFAGSNISITTDATNDKVTFSVADGTTSAKGVVKLTDSTSSTSTTTAATPKSVKSAYDLADIANTAARAAQTKADNAYTLADGKLSAAGGNISGHVYLTGAKPASSTTNTSQIVFGTASENHVAISSNDNALVINPDTSSTTHQIVLYLDKASQFPSGITANVTGNLTGTASKATADASGNNIANTYATKTAVNAKQDTITGGASTITSANLTASRALVSDVSGKVAVSAVTATELGYLDGVTSAIQTQLDGKAAASHGTHVSFGTTAPVADGTASVGSASTVARSDHKHPTDTTRAAQSDLTSHTGSTTVHITSTERTNWNAAKTHADTAHAPSNAEKNQNAFSNVTIGSTTIAADTTTDTLTLVAGSNITLTPDATNDKITIAAAGTSYSHPTYTQVASSNKAEAPAFGGSVTIQQITSDSYGHVSGTTNKSITIPSATATDTASGLMSAADKVKLDSIDTSKYLPKAGGTITGDIDMNDNTISNVDEISAGYVCCEEVYVTNADQNKGAYLTYSDTETGTNSTGNAVDKPVVTLYGVLGDEATIIRNVAAPSGNSDAANKEYVDTTITRVLTDDRYTTEQDLDYYLNYYLPKSGGTLTGDINLNNNDITGAYSISSLVNTATYASTTSLSLVDEYDNGSNISPLDYEDDGDGNEAAVLIFEGSTGDQATILRNIATPNEGYDAANKKYVDDAVANVSSGGSVDMSSYLPKSGGTMTGAITIAQGDGKGIQIGKNGFINATTSTGDTGATICGVSDAARAIIGHSSFVLKLRGSEARPKYNEKTLALYTYIPVTYAGASSAGGAATSANKLNTNAGASDKPVYFQNGIPVACRLMVGENVEGQEFTLLSDESTVVAGQWAERFNGSCFATGQCSHAEGCFTEATGEASHSEGYFTIASGRYSHAESNQTQATGECSHAEGQGTVASGLRSHAEGSGTVASNHGAHAEGISATASASGAHAEGHGTTASGIYSHAEGCYTTALVNQHAQGHYNNTATATAGVYSGTSAGTAFVIGNGTSSAKSNAFRVAYNGTPYAKSALTTTGADYAEYFEWADLNKNNEDRRGYFVTLDGKKIKLAEPNDYILGIVSGQPSVIGNGDEDWLGRYMFDEFGAFIYEDFEYEEEVPVNVVDENTGKTVVEMQKVTKIGKKYKENPDYDPTQPYIQREDRPEWSTVGMVGVLSVRDDSTCQVNGYCKVANGGIATASDTGYRVIERVNDHIVKVIFR